MTGDELHRFEVSTEQNDSLREASFDAFLIEGNEMVLATQDCRFFTYDISSGDLLRTHDPLR